MLSTAIIAIILFFIVHPLGVKLEEKKHMRYVKRLIQNKYIATIGKKDANLASNLRQEIENKSFFDVM